MVSEVPNQSPYMGGEVEVTTMPNGAFVNKKTADYYTRRAQPQITKLKEGLTVLERYSLENTLIIEGKEGVIVWDTGSNMGIGRKKYQLLRQITVKPVKAIIYSHQHYVRGTQAFIDKENSKEVPIIAHPDLHNNLINSALDLGPSLSRNLAQHFGLHLPRTGPDAPPIVYEGDENDDKTSGYIQPTYGVKDGEKLTIDGVRMQFFYAPSDTNDSLSMWLPDHDAVITNAILGSFPNMYTLRGQPYRNPINWIEGLDKIRQIRPKYLIPEHGSPITIREESYELLTYYRDAIAFVYSQTVRGINKGMKPDEIAENLTLPEHLANYPRLIEVYGELKHHVKGVYSGLIGWFSLDAADINPVSVSFRSERIVKGFGGEKLMIHAANQALKSKEYAWAAELITHLLNLKPDHQEASQIKADALRQMGYVSPALSSRNFYLSQAHALEGKINLYSIPNGFPKSFNEKEIEMLPFESFIKVMENRINANKSEQLDKVMAIEITDLNKTYGLHVRKGVAEFLEQKPDTFDFCIKLSRITWINIISGRISLLKAFEKDDVITDGNESEIFNFIEVFDLEL